MRACLRLVASASLIALVSQGLPAREIQWAPSRFEGDAALDVLPLRFAYYPTANRIRVSHGACDEDAASGVFSIRNARGERVFTRTVTDAKDWTASVPDLKAETLRVGDGGYVAEFVETDGATHRVPFRRDVFGWEGNRYGLSDTVPAPFAPVDVSDGKVRTVLREHTLDSLGLMCRLVADGKDVLAAPMRLIATKDGKPVVVTGSGFRFTEVARSKASGFATFDLPFLKGRIDGTWWCDGVFDCRLTFEFGSVDELHLQIPLRGEVATHLHAVKNGTRNNWAGRIPDGKWIVWHGGKLAAGPFASDYVPYLWVGGPLRGLSVFGENDRGWTHGRWTCQDVRRNEDGTVDIWLNIFQGAVEIRRPRTVRLGFQATPVKPMEEGWRAIGDEHLLGGCWYWGAQTPCNDLEPHDGTDRFYEAMAQARRTGKVDEGFVDDFLRSYRFSPVVDPASASNRLAEVRRHALIGLREAAASKDGKRSLTFYTNGRGIRLGVPPGSTFCDEWRCFRNVNRAAFDVDASGAYELDPVPTFLDYAASCWRRMVGSGACDSLYFDDVFLAGNRNPETSDAFRTSDGVIHAASGIFAMREQVRRAAVVMAELGKPCRRNWIHTSRTAMAPVSSFAGVHYDMEDNNARSPVQERYSRDYLVAETIGRQFGVRTRVMCYFDGADPRDLEGLVDGALGVMLTHELEWRRMGRWNALRSNLLDWGYGEKATQVWNYWDAETYPVEVGGLETSSLAMRRQDGAALVVVSSWEKRDGIAQLKPSASLVASPYVATDWLTGEALDLRDGVVHVPLAGYRWRIVALTPGCSADSAALPTDEIECKWPMTVPWATEVEVEPLSGGQPFMTFVKGGYLILKGRRGARFRCRWNDLNGVPDEMTVELRDN